MTVRLSAIADKYGLTPNEADRALKWAQVAKEVRARHDYPADPNRVWCAQCDRAVKIEEAQNCTSKWCKAK